MEKVSRDKRENNINYQPEMHVRDVNSREIFKNDLLTSQFLRNYTNIPLLSNVMPEDIEDVSQKYQAFLGVEYEADTIKKVYIRSTDGTIEKECRQRAFHARNVQRALFFARLLRGRGLGPQSRPVLISVPHGQRDGQHRHQTELDGTHRAVTAAPAMLPAQEQR